MDHGTWRRDGPKQNSEKRWTATIFNVLLVCNKYFSKFFMLKVMPNVYLSKLPSESRRGLWTQEQLMNAIDAVKTKVLGVNEAAKTYGIPSTTLKNRLKK